jgi:hypothetical protein
VWGFEELQDMYRDKSHRAWCVLPPSTPPPLPLPPCLALFRPGLVVAGIRLFV